MATDIVFTYVTESSGHKVAANAICKALHEITPDVTTRCLDSSYAYPVLSPILSQFYLEIISKTPQIWDFVWNNSDVKEATKEIRNLFNIINIPKVNKLLKMYHPKIFISTHALPANIIAFQKSNNGLDKPLVGIVTDYGIHSYWFNKEIDLYMVANREMYNELIKNGIPKTKIQITGIPIDPAFLNSINKKVAKKYFGMDPLMFTVLITGASRGLLPLYEILTHLADLYLPIQYLVITGKNKKLFHELKEDFSDKKNFHIFRYIKSVNLAMDASDVIITKAGGLTITEAITKNLPMIILQPLPGQERINTQYLLKHRIAEKCNNISELPEIIYNYFNQPKRLSLYRNRLTHFAKPYAAYSCAKLITNLLENEKKE